MPYTTDPLRDPARPALQPFVEIVTILVATPLVAFGLTWLVGAPLVATRACLGLVGADRHELALHVSDHVVCAASLVLVLAHALWVHVRPLRATDSRPAWRVAARRVFLCGVLVGIAALSIAVEVAHAIDLPPWVQQLAALAAFAAWTMVVTVAAVSLTSMSVRYVITGMGAPRPARMMASAMLLVPAAICASVLVFPQELRAYAASGSNVVAGLSDGTTTLLGQIAAGPGALPPATEGPGDEDGPAAPSEPTRYEVNECLEELVSVNNPAPGTLRDTARCDSRPSPMEDVWCSLRRAYPVSDLEDALVESAIKTCLAEPVRTENGLTGYLRTATIRTLHQSHRRDASRWRNAPLYYERVQASDQPVDGDSACAEKLAEALEALKPADRDLFLQKYQDGATWPEIAAQTGKSEAAVTKKGERLRKSLSAVLRTVCER